MVDNRHARSLRVVLNGLRTVIPITEGWYSMVIISMPYHCGLVLNVDIVCPHTDVGSSG